MTSIGETLRSERIRRRLDLEQVSRETKISTKLLDAIESEQFEKLPGGVFTKSFVRQYARVLGLDDSEIVNELDRVLHPPQPEEEPELERYEPISVPKVASWNVGKRSSASNSALPAFALVVVVMLVCSAIYAWWQRSRNPAPAAGETASAPAQMAAKKPAPAPAQSAERADTAPQPLVTPAVSTEPSTVTPASQAPTAPVHILLSAQESVWVSARTDGDQGFMGTMEPGDTRTVEAKENVRLVIGNAGGLSITLNGKPLGALGKSGQVLVMEMTPQGSQTVRRNPPVPDASL